MHKADLTKPLYSAIAKLSQTKGSFMLWYLIPLLNVTLTLISFSSPQVYQWQEGFHAGTVLCSPATVTAHGTGCLWGSSNADKPPAFPQHLALSTAQCYFASFGSLQTI